MTEPIIGAVYRTEADSIVGWCWNPSRSHAQCTVEVLIDGTLWRELRAERRLAGVKLNGPPHDHFGFLAPLPPRGKLPWHRIELREQRTGQVFGRLIEGGTDPGQTLMLQRIDALRRQVAEIDISGALPPSATDLFNSVGNALRQTPLSPLCLPSWTPPKISLLIYGCQTPRAAYRAITLLLGQAADLQAEILLIGEFPSLVATLRGIRLIGAASIGASLDMAQGDYILLLNGPQLGSIIDLADWLQTGLILGSCDKDSSSAGSALLLGIGRQDWAAMTAIPSATPEQTLADIAAQADLLCMPVRTTC